MRKERVNSVVGLGRDYFCLVKFVTSHQGFYRPPVALEGLIPGCVFIEREEDPRNTNIFTPKFDLFDKLVEGRRKEERTDRQTLQRVD